MNIYLIILIIILFPLVFTAIVNMARSNLFNNINKSAEPFTLFELPKRSQIVDYKDSTVPHYIVKGLSKLNKETSTFELPIISGLSRINTYMVFFPESYSIEKLEDFLIQSLDKTSFKIFFRDEIEITQNNPRAWKKFFKGNYAESEMMEKVGFNVKERFLYISAKSEEVNRFLNFTGFSSGILKKRMVLIITLSSQ